MKNEHVNDKRFVRLENVLASDYIPFLSGRPERQDSISHDDETNLKIMLNLTRNVNEFISAI